MEAHTQIIEFFGLPACGKSTLRDSLLSDQEGNTTYCKMTAISLEYRKISIFKKIKVFPYRASLELAKLIVKSGVSLTKFPIYKGFFSLLIIYAYSRHTKSFGYMLMDHGIIQTIVSLFYGVDYKKFELSLDIITRLLNSIRIDIPVNCVIPIDISTQRMRKRNRKDSGRLDAIKDDNELEHAMSIQARQFLALSNLIDVNIIDMTLSTVQCKSVILNILNK